MQHLDEGTIHAWLDDALTAEEAGRVERHAGECAQCAALVAESRGLVAGASRILSALDDVPTVVPIGVGGGRRAESDESFARASLRAPTSAPRPRWWSRPAALAAAASLVLMAGSAIVLTKSGRNAVGGYAADNAAPLHAPTTEAEGASAVPRALTDTQAAAGGGATSRDGADTAASASSATAPLVSTQLAERQRPTATKAVQRRAAESRAAMPSGGRAANAPLPDSVRQFDQMARAEAAPAAQKEPAFNEKAAAPAPPPAAADAALEQRAPVQQRALARRAPAGRARSEQPVPTTAAEGQQRLARADTVVITKVDTVTAIVASPDLPGLRGSGRTAVATRPFPVTGCYEVVGRGLPRSITLTGTPVWSGAAERAFRATAPGATGYWSQPKTGDVHIVIARWIVKARIDALTGELRGTAQRGRTNEPFVARRCR